SQGQTGVESPNQPPEPVPEQPPSRDKVKEAKKSGEPPYTAARFDEMTWGLEVTEEKKNEAAGIDRQAHQVEEMEWRDLIGYRPPPSESREWLGEIHKRLALPAACLVFALLGVGFGISNVRTGRSFGLLLGLAITLAYYLMALWGQHSAMAGTLPVWLGIWLANIVLALVGMAVLIGQRRPGSDPLSMLSSLRHAFTSKKHGVETGRQVASPRRP